MANAVKSGLDYLPRVEQMKAIGAFLTLYGPRPVVGAYHQLCHCPACRHERGEPPELGPIGWPACPGCGKRHPPEG